MVADSRPLRRDAQRNRELLLAAAREVFGVKGLDAPLEEIARRAGVAIGTLYNRFPTRIALIEATFAGLIRAWGEIAEEVLAFEDPWDGFAHFVVQTCEMQSVDRGLTEVCTRTIAGAPEIEQGKARAWDLLTCLITRAQEAGRLRADFQPIDLAVAIGAAAHAADISPDPETWRRHLTFLLDGFRTHPDARK
jgi:AcrR family transcriptional regulator